MAALHFTAPCPADGAHGRHGHGAINRTAITARQASGTASPCGTAAARRLPVRCCCAAGGCPSSLLSKGIPASILPTNAVKLQDACGVPLGLVAQPLAASHGSGGTAFPAAACWASDLARCARCHAYINALCEVDDESWACALCGCSNDFSSATSLRR